MAIWLKRARDAVFEPGASLAGGTTNDLALRLGAASDIVRRDTFGELLSLDAARAALVEERAALLDEARALAQTLIDHARDEAADIVANAQRDYAEASEQGYRDGCERAIADWMERLAQAADAQNRLQSSMRERLANIVATAVEQIVRVESHEALFERALATVDRIVDGATYLRVAVCPGDFDGAKAAFDRLAARWRDLGQAIPMSVIADKQLDPGSCVCETDFGTVDASLDMQLRAMRSAVSRALKRSAHTSAEAQDAPDAFDNASAGEASATEAV
ncbi:type III secretion protein L [Paraburkholderia tropica]|uniref:type III secretion system stator protein SctL n=1 Tax=Paraburkholderia tropica TaxID=92647 RepID=UPI00160FC28B|nr:type III secretion system stator protein SctL [Paraburkholderia tropica]MBB3000381.1 type III secretion protein L [Paraburkholderia tropica]MBB6320010.1 type III secretion protein L [Paraburkholderia tropica]